MLGLAEEDYTPPLQEWEARGKRRDERCQLERRGFTRESPETICWCTPREREREIGSNQPITVCQRFWFLRDARFLFASFDSCAVRSSSKYFHRGLTFGGKARTHKKRSGVQQRCVWSWAWLQGAFQPQCLTNRYNHHPHQDQDILDNRHHHLCDPHQHHHPSSLHYFKVNGLQNKGYASTLASKTSNHCQNESCSVIIIAMIEKATLRCTKKRP